MLQATLTKNFKNKAERHKADYEMEKSRREQKERDLQDAEERIKKLRDEIAFLEDSFEVVAKRPLMKSDLDSPELHAEKKVRMEEVPDNDYAIKSLEGTASREKVKSPKGIKSMKDAGIKKKKEARSSGSKPKEDSEEILVLDSEGDIVSGKDEAVALSKHKPGHKDYYNTQASDRSDIMGENRHVKPPPLKTLLGENGLHCSDAQLRKQSLIAWRNHLKSQGEYKPDRRLPSETHLKHIKILMAALSNFRHERIRNDLKPRAKLFYTHDQYSFMYMSYHVPADTCSPYELMSKVDKDRDILYRLRCVPLSEFYSMLMEDTPGYVPSGHWSKPPIQELSRGKSIRDDRSKSSSRSSQSPESAPKSPIMNQESSKHVSRIQESSKHMSSSSREPTAIMNESSSNTSSVNVMWGSTEHLSSRRYKNMQRGQRFNPIVGEEKGYSSESGNEKEDEDNSLYDSRLPPADKRKLADCQWKIKKIKQQDFPKEYLEAREEWLKEAEAARIKNGTVPVCLHDVAPPWDKGQGLALSRYNEMIVYNINHSINELRERNAASCAKLEAANVHGPRDGQDRR
jgi:hypothetical protein